MGILNGLKDLIFGKEPEPEPEPPVFFIFGPKPKPEAWLESREEGLEEWRAEQTWRKPKTRDEIRAELRQKYLDGVEYPTVISEYETYDETPW